MKIFNFFKKKKLEPEVISARKASTIEQELLDRCKNGHRIDPEIDYSHATGICSYAIGNYSVSCDTYWHAKGVYSDADDYKSNN